MTFEFSSEWNHSIKLFTGLFAVLNPLGAVPLFASLTQARTAPERHHIARVASLTVMVVLLIAFFTGEWFLDFFGISLASFRIGGGILILLTAIAMLHARRTGIKQSREESEEIHSRSEIAVVPLGIPMLAGPGSISTVILYRHQAHTNVDVVSTLVMITALAFTIFLILNYSSPLVNKLGRTGLNIISRVMGLILAALAVEFIAEGLIDFFPILTRTLP